MTLWKRAVAFGAGVLCALSAVGCGDFFVSSSTISSVSITPTSVLLVGGGDTVSLSAQSLTVGGTTNTVTTTANWSSSNNSVVTVSGGVVTPGSVPSGNSIGTATISAEVSGKTGTATALVTDSTLPTSLTVVGASTIGIGTASQFHAIIVLNNTNTDITSNVTWTTTTGLSNVVTVGSTGAVTGVSACSALTTICPGITATITTASGPISGTLSLTAVQ